MDSTFILKVPRQGAMIDRGVGQGWSGEHSICVHTTVQRERFTRVPRVGAVRVAVMRSVRQRRNTCWTAYSVKVMWSMRTMCLSRFHLNPVGCSLFLVIHPLLFHLPVSPVQRAKLIPATSHSICSHSFSLHPHRQTLLKATGGTTFPLRKVHRAALLFCTSVMLVILH